MVSHRKRIAFDNDDVIAAFVEHLLAFHNAKYGTQVQRADMRQFFLHDVMGLERAEWLRRIDEYYSSEQHTAMLPIDGAVDALRALAHDHELVVITARPKHVEHITHAWFERHLPGVISSVYHVGTHNRHEEKAKLCRELAVDFFVDDNEETVRLCLAHGVRAVLFDAPWNASCTDAPRARTWPELVALIRELEER
jgi:uncharacterized protein